jgi:hypothetical protein
VAMVVQFFMDKLPSFPPPKLLLFFWKSKATDEVAF